MTPLITVFFLGPPCSKTLASSQSYLVRRCLNPRKRGGAWGKTYSQGVTGRLGFDTAKMIKKLKIES